MGSTLHSLVRRTAVQNDLDTQARYEQELRRAAAAEQLEEQLQEQRRLGETEARRMEVETLPATVLDGADKNAGRRCGREATLSLAFTLCTMQATCSIS